MQTLVTLVTELLDVLEKNLFAKERNNWACGSWEQGLELTRAGVVRAVTVTGPP